MNTLSPQAQVERHSDLLAKLQGFLPADAIIEEAEAQRPFECDALTLYRELPLLVVLPSTASQVQKILQLCHELCVPVVPRGSGTGLCAGAMPHPEGIVLGLSKMNTIVDIDPLARTARVQPGVTNLSISDAAAVHGLYYAPDPSSQIACSIGGNVAENSGGVHCLKYGLTVHNILSLEVLTAAGDAMTIGGKGLDSPALDLLPLLIGSEGLLAVVTEVTVKLLPSPEIAQVIMAGFDSVEKAGNAVNHIIGAGIIPAGLEMMDALATQAAEDFVHAGYPREAAALLLCEVDGTLEEVEEHIARVSRLFKEAGATSIKVSHNEAERELLWRGRKAAFPAVGRLAADYYCMDGTIPRGKVAYVLAEIAHMAAAYDLRVANVFHAGDGNLHPLILFDGGCQDEIRKAEALGADILEFSVKVGGCLTGEHGVGLEKLAQMPSQFSTAELLQLEEIKAAFDPKLMLNPGKGIPILKRCQEYRALPARHSHGDAL